MIDLFGKEGRAPGLRALPEPFSLNLFDAAAEHAAIASFRPVSQERAEILAPDPVAGLIGSCIVCGTRLALLVTTGRTEFACPRCEG